MLEQVLAAPANRVETAEVARSGELSQGGTCCRTAEAAKVERRRETLINSYTHWASTRDRRRTKRDQARTVGAISSSEDSSVQGTVGTTLDKRGAAATGKRKQGTSEVGTLVTASGYGRPTINGSVDTARGGHNDRALISFSPTVGASRQLLLYHSLRRARVLGRGNSTYGLSRGASLVRETPPFRGLQLFYDRRSPPESDVLDALPPAPAEVTERAISIVTEAPDCTRSIAVRPRARHNGVCVIAGVMPPTKARSTLEVAEMSMSKASPQAVETGCPADRKLEIEHPLQGSSVDIIPSRSPVVGAERYAFGSINFSSVHNSLCASGRFARENEAGGVDNDQRKLSEVEEESLPTLASRVRPRSGTYTGVHGESSCRDIIVSTRALASEGRIVKRKVCNSVPATSRVRSALLSSTAPDCRNTTRSEEKQRVAGFPPPHSNTSLREEVTDINLDALMQSGNTAVEMAIVPRLPHPDDDEQRQMTPFLGYGGRPGAGSDHTTVVLPVEVRSVFPKMEAHRSQPKVGCDQYTAGGGSGRLLLCDGRPRADDVRTLRPSLEDIGVRQRRSGQSTMNGSNVPPRPVAPAVKVVGVDSILPDSSETSIIPYAKAGAAARTCTSDSTKKGVGGELPHPTLAPQGNGNGRWSEPWNNGGSSVGTIAHQQDLGYFEVPPICARAIVPRPYIGEGDVVPQTAVDLFHAKEPAKPALQNAKKSQITDDTPASAGAESKCPSGKAAVSAQGDTKVSQQHKGDEAAGLGEAVINHHSADDNQPEGKGGVLSATRRGKDSGELCASAGPDKSSVSPPGAPGNLPTFPAGPQPETEIQPPTAGGKDNCGLAAPPPLACLPVLPPCLSSPLPLAALGESVVHQTERDDTELATVGPVSAALVKGMTGEDSTTKATPAGSSPAAPPPTGFAPQPPALSPLPRSPPPLRSKQSAPSTTAVADAGVELGSSVELFSVDTALRDTNLDDDDRVLSTPVVHRRRHEYHDRRWTELCAAGQGRAEHEHTERGCTSPACK